VTTVAAATSSNTSNAIVRRDASGNFTGGTITATGPLFVNTTTRIQRTAAGLFMGIGAGNATGTGGTNIAIGQNAEAALTSGDGNTALGWFSLNSVTTGSSNTALGNGTLSNLVNANGNTAVGASAMPSITSGGFNTAVGSNTMVTATTAISNVAIGSSALQLLTTGQDNTAVGTNAGAAMTTGLSNVAIGNLAFFNSASGVLNTVVGTSALNAHPSGTGNTVLGAGSAQSLTSGNQNTFVGTSAANVLTTGSNNVIIGASAGQTLTSGSFNIYIGADSPGASEGNAIRIGGGSQGSAFIAGVFNANVGAGTQVFVNSNGQLGTTSSSRRFKKDIESIGARSHELLRLRPVTFRYKSGDDGLQYGLIAEEVAEVDPSLVLFGPDGRPQTVRYHFLAPLLLNELQEQQRVIDAQQAAIGELLRRVEALERAR
jgi:hypothetical protein